MTYARELSIHSYPNSSSGRKPREPQVHLMLGGDCVPDGLQSICFPAALADQIALAVANAGRRAKAGYASREIEIKWKENY